jgi:hypothetical protein
MVAKSRNVEPSASMLRRLRQLFVAVPVVAATLVAGCATDDEIDPSACDAPVLYRVNQVQWPANHEQARTIGFDLDGNGVVDNQLGTLAVSLDNYFVEPFDLSGSATAQMVDRVAWDLAVQQCPSDRVLVTINGGEPIAGRSIDGVIDARGAGGEVPLAALADPTGSVADPGWRASKASALRLVASGDQLVGDVGMAPAQDDVSSAVVAAMTAFVDGRVEEQPELLEVLDTNGDGTISYTEISESTLVKSLLAPDLVDLDATSMAVAIVATRL